MSPSARVNVALALLLGLIVAAHWAVPPSPTQRNFHFFPDMVNSPAHEAQAPAPLFAGGTVDLRPPEGSVARGYLPLLYEATPEDAARAGAELRSPHGDAAVAGAVERGGFVFATFCVTCHGAGGEGDGPVTLRGVPPPPSLLLPHAMELADGQMYHITTFGQGNMAGYASQVGRADRWNVISYIRTLQAPARAQAAAAPEPAAAAPGDGAAPPDAPAEETVAPAEEAAAEAAPAEQISHRSPSREVLHLSPSGGTSSALQETTP